ncbi:MAG: pseudouridine synthase [Planctomycetota bacterium]
MKSQQPPIEVLYRDQAMVAVAKPGGLLVHRSRESTDRVFLLQLLRDQLGAHLFPVHRLDRATSGVMVFAFSSDDARLLQSALESATKDYVVLVRGATASAFDCDRPLRNERGEPQECRSSFVKLAEFSRCSLLQGTIQTGRRHQIRRHLAHAAYQVIGDTTYGKGRINQFFRDEYALPRLFLHSWRLTVCHPRDGRSLQLGVPLAADLTAFLRRLPDVPADVVAALTAPIMPPAGGGSCQSGD